MNTSKTLLVTALISLSLSACSNQPSANPGAEAAAPAAQEAPADPNAINTAIPPEAFKAKLSIEGQPAIAADGSNAVYTLKIENLGTANLYGVGSAAINMGTQILGTDNTAEPANGGVRDFSRTALPLIQAGQSISVPVTIAADDRMNGRQLRFSLVQEGVTWHDEDAVDVAALPVADGKFAPAAQ